MTKKRPSIKGKGAEIFFEKQNDPSPTPIPLKQHDRKEIQEKATFYLPSFLLDRLDEIGLQLRRKNRKLRKSEIVRIALD